MKTGAGTSLAKRGAFLEEGSRIASRWEKDSEWGCWKGREKGKGTIFHLGVPPPKIQIFRRETVGGQL